MRNTAIMNAVRGTKGRFFGLYTKQGESLNAQYLGESDSYINVYDRNNRRKRKIAKASLSGIYSQGNSIGHTF